MTQLTTAFAHSRSSYGILHGSLQQRLREMVATLNTRAWIDRLFRGGKDILPEPRPARVRVLAFKGIRQIHIAVPFSHLRFVQEMNFSEMGVQRLLKGLRQHRHAVLSTLAIPHGKPPSGPLIGCSTAVGEWAVGITVRVCSRPLTAAADTWR